MMALSSSGLVTFSSLLPSSNIVSVPSPSPSDLQLYRSMASLSKLSAPPVLARRVSSTTLPHPLARRNPEQNVMTEVVVRPLVSHRSKAVYERHVMVGLQGPASPNQHSLKLYQSYAAMAGVVN